MHRNSGCYALSAAIRNHKTRIKLRQDMVINEQHRTGDVLILEYYGNRFQHKRKP